MLNLKELMKDADDVDIFLIRYQSDAVRTKGILLTNKFSCYTLEPPWLDNIRSKSCIPTGRYTCVRYHSGRFGYSYLVKNVPERSGILIRCGNTVNDTKGSILVGNGWEGNVLINTHIAMRLLKDRFFKRSSFILQVKDLNENQLSEQDIRLDTLSARFESGPKGSKAIGWDSTGGTSYGRYQIATRTGTFNEFLKWCKSSNDPNAIEVAKRLESAGNPDSGRRGPVAQEWKKLVDEGKIQPLEYSFIKHTHYDKAFHRLPEDVVKEVSDNPVLQKILWSTAVQHGPYGASRIFERAYRKSNGDTKKFVSDIYKERSTKFGHSSPRVRRAVQRRFEQESKIALRELGGSHG